MTLASLLAFAPSVFFHPTPAQEEAVPVQAAVYHVHFVKAAPGKAADLLESLRTRPSADPERGADEILVLQHLEGDDWDYLVIEHQGRSAAVEASLPAGLSPEEIRRARAAREWHADTFVAGPPLAEFKKALGVDAKGKVAEDAVYIVSQYRSVPGHRDEMEKALDRITAASKDPAASVLLRHLEGGTWEVLSLHRYDSWSALASEMTDPEAENRERAQGFTRSPSLVLRDHMASHHDTIAARVLTEAQEAK